MDTSRNSDCAHTASPRALRRWRNRAPFANAPGLALHHLSLYIINFHKVINYFTSDPLLYCQYVLAFSGIEYANYARLHFATPIVKCRSSPCSLTYHATGTDTRDEPRTLSAVRRIAKCADSNGVISGCSRSSPPPISDPISMKLEPDKVVDAQKILLLQRDSQRNPQVLTRFLEASWYIDARFECLFDQGVVWHEWRDGRLAPVEWRQHGLVCHLYRWRIRLASDDKFRRIDLFQIYYL